MSEVRALHHSGDYLCADVKFRIGMIKIGGVDTDPFVGPKNGFLRKRSSIYPLTAPGWAAAWAEYSRVDPAGAEQYGGRLLKTEQQRQQDEITAGRKQGRAAQKRLKASNVQNPKAIGANA